MPILGSVPSAEEFAAEHAELGPVIAAAAVAAVAQTDSVAVEHSPAFAVHLAVTSAVRAAVVVDSILQSVALAPFGAVAVEKVAESAAFVELAVEDIVALVDHYTVAVLHIVV